MMEIAGLEAVKSFETLKPLQNSVFAKNDTADENSTPFDALLGSAMDMLKETTAYTNAASEAELSYASGGDLSTTDVMLAQMKANMSLQFTVAIRNAVMDAYKEIMQINF